MNKVPVTKEDADAFTEELRGVFKKWDALMWSDPCGDIFVTFHDGTELEFGHEIDISMEDT